MPRGAFPSLFAEGGDPYVVDHLEFGRNSLINSVPSQKTVYFNEALYGLVSEEVNGYRPHTLQPVNVVVVSLADVESHPNQPPGTPVPSSSVDVPAYFINGHTPAPAVNFSVNSGASFGWCAWYGCTADSTDVYINYAKDINVFTLDNAPAGVVTTVALLLNGNPVYTYSQIGGQIGYPNISNNMVFDEVVLSWNSPTTWEITAGSYDLAPVPEPSTLAMLGNGIIGLASVLRKRVLS